MTAAIAASSFSNTRAGPSCVDALVAGELDHAALGGEVAAQDREAAGGLDRRRRAGRTTRWPGVSCASRGVLADRAAGDGLGVVVEHAQLLQALGDDGDPAGLVQVGGDVAPAGLEVAEHRRVCEAMRSKSSMSSSTPASRAIASRCRTPLVEPPLVATAAIAFSSPSRVMMSLGRWPRASTSMISLPAS